MGSSAPGKYLSHSVMNSSLRFASISFILSMSPPPGDVAATPFYAREYILLPESEI
jgi:hypothetical protein